jgi:hypothetical protein
VTAKVALIDLNLARHLFGRLGIQRRENHLAELVVNRIAVLRLMPEISAAVRAVTLPQKYLISSS